MLTRRLLLSIPLTLFAKDSDKSKILKALEGESTGLTLKDIARTTKLKIEIVEREMVKMIDSGEIVRRRGNLGTLYLLSENGEEGPEFRNGEEK